MPLLPLPLEDAAWLDLLWEVESCMASFGASVMASLVCDDAAGNLYPGTAQTSLSACKHVQLAKRSAAGSLIGTSCQLKRMILYVTLALFVPAFPILHLAQST
jgi:hypothetical protein